MGDKTANRQKNWLYRKSIEDEVYPNLHYIQKNEHQTVASV